MIRLSVLAFSGSTVICVMRRCKPMQTAAISCLECDAKGQANDASGRGSDAKTIAFRGYPRSAHVYARGVVLAGGDQDPPGKPARHVANPA